MTECNWCKDEICVNADCPICCDYCPVPGTEGVCKFEDRSERHFTVVEGRMKEYIDREEALLAIKQAFEKGERPSLYIKSIPAADVAEVRHGKWIQPHWKNSNYCCNCSECGGEAMHREYQWDKNGIYPVCPNCGAKMDKEDAWKDDALGQKED